MGQLSIFKRADIIEKKMEKTRWKAIAINGIK